MGLGSHPHSVQYIYKFAPRTDIENGAARWTLLSAQFIRTKIEAGLLEDLLRDFQECLLVCHGIAETMHAVSESDSQTLTKPMPSQLITET